MRDDSSEEEEPKSKSGKDRRRRKNKDVDRKESKRDGKKIVKGGDGESDDELIEGDVVRKSMGLDFMLPPTRKADPNPALDVDEKFKESTVEEVSEVFVLNWRFFVLVRSSRWLMNALFRAGGESKPKGAKSSLQRQWNRFSRRRS